MNRCGTTRGYKDHKRAGEPTCAPCRAAVAARERVYEARRALHRGPLIIDATGTRRRLQALMRIGWSGPALGAELGISGGAVWGLMQKPRVHRRTAAKVAALYDRLWNQPGPSKRTVQRAQANGWVPPLGLDDEFIDDPNYSPGTDWMRGPAERAEVVRRLTAAGLSAAEIASRLGVTPRTVTRLRGRAAA